MAEMELYGYWRSSCSYRVRIALNCKEIDYLDHPVHLVKDGGQQHTERYRALNPMGQVPCLIHQGKAVTQSMAILEYLDQIVPEPALFPREPLAAAAVRQLCETINAGIQPLQNLSVLQHLKSEHGFSPEQVQDWCRHWIAKGFAAFEQMLSATSGSFCHGDAVSAADAFLVPQVYNARRFNLDMDAYPRISRINDHCLTLPAFEKAVPERQADAPAAT